MKRPGGWRAALARLSLPQQLVLAMAALLALGTVLAGLLHAALLRTHALERARAIALMADAASTWCSQYRGVWVLSDPGDPGVEIGDALDHRQARMPDAASPAPHGGIRVGEPAPSVDIARTAATFHRKVPSAMQRELSDVLARGPWSGARVRVAHELPLDPRNAPDGFEQAAIARLRLEDAVHDARAEFHDVAGGRLRYARRLSVDADCLRCHAASPVAPAAMKARYGASAAWVDRRDGAYGGIVSVSLPLVDGHAGVDAMAWSFLGAWTLTFALLLAWVRHHVLRLEASP